MMMRIGNFSGFVVAEVLHLSFLTGCEVLSSTDLHKLTLMDVQWMHFLNYGELTCGRYSYINPSLCFLLLPLANYGRHCKGKEGICPEVCPVPHCRGGRQAQSGSQPLGSVWAEDGPGRGLLVHGCQQEQRSVALMGFDRHADSAASRPMHVTRM